MPQWPFSWPSGSVQNITCLTILFALIASAVCAVLIPGWLRQMQTPRPHNTERLVNECFASYQLTYLAFYPTLIRLAKPSSENEYITQVMIGLIFLALTFSVYSFYKVFTQEQTLRKLHTCKGNVSETQWEQLFEYFRGFGFSEPRSRQIVRDIETTDCDLELSKQAKLKIYGLPLIFALLSFLFAMIVALSPIFPPKD